MQTRAIVVVVVTVVAAVVVLVVTVLVDVVGSPHVAWYLYNQVGKRSMMPDQGRFPS